jgi:hypothetical protein
VAAALNRKWPDDVLFYLPILESCLSRTPYRPASVSAAWTFKNGVVGVTTRDAESTRHVCLAITDDGLYIFRRAMPAEKLPAEGPFFHSADLATASPCPNAKAVRNGAGKVVGWLNDAQCD